MIGISRWQCGHQWAMKITTLGLPSLVMSTGVPSNDLPLTDGIGLLMAGSAAAWLLGMSGNAVPVTVTGCVSEKPAATVVSVDDLSFDLPPRLATMAITPTTTTMPITMAKMGIFDGWAFLGGGLRAVLVASRPPGAGQRGARE